MPLPASLGSLFGGGGGAAIGGGIAAKAVLVGAAAAVATGFGVEGARHHMWPQLVAPRHVAAKQAPAKPAPKPKPTTLAAVGHAVLSVPVAARLDVRAPPRSDMRPLKHVEHENNVRGARTTGHARSEHRLPPQHPAAPAHEAAPLPPAAVQRARVRAHHVPAARRHGSPAAATTPANAHLPTPKPAPPPQSQPTVQPASPASNDNGNGGNGNGGGQEKKQP